MGRLMYLRDVVTLDFDPGKCVGCGMCTVVCPRGVWYLDNGKAEIRDRDACMECGACRANCPADAIDVVSGVGCAAAVINGALGRRNRACCSIDPQGKSDGPGKTIDGKKGAACC
ncbi:MAG: 4Fe-4S binding protein [Deltaproteobacteria bacterium]|nr:4Fe-4S binding protein [Deltaproteobacteria bacterium]